MPDRRPTFDSIIVAAHEPTPVTVVERPAAAAADRGGMAWLWKWLGVAGVLAIFAAGIAWRDIRAHAQNTVVHPLPDAVVNGGGFAFRGDVQTALERALRETRLLRRDLRGATLDCEQRKGGGVSCKIVVPESE